MRSCAGDERPSASKPRDSMPADASSSYSDARMTYQFGSFEFDDRSMELRKNGRLMAIEPQPARALALLLSRANDVVTRDELRLAVWGPDTHVDFDRGLAYCLSAIRQALGDKGDNPRFVQTLPRKGYCFVAPVRPGDRSPATPASNGASAQPSPIVVPSAIDAPSGVSRVPKWLSWAALLAVLGVGVGWFTTSRSTGAAHSVIAVSVFDNETGDPTYDRLVSGLSDTVVVRLTELAPARLAVVGNAEVLRKPRNIRNLKALASAIRADYVVLGQLQRTDAGLRFVTHLIRLPEETHLRARRLPVPAGDFAGIESVVMAEFEQAVREHVLAR